MQQFEVAWGQSVVPGTEIAGKGDIGKHISTGFPYTPNLIFTQLQKQWQLSCKRNIFNTDAQAHLNNQSG